MFVAIDTALYAQNNLILIDNDIHICGHTNLATMFINNDAITLVY